MRWYMPALSLSCQTTQAAFFYGVYRKQPTYNTERNLLKVCYQAQIKGGREIVV